MKHLEISIQAEPIELFRLLKLARFAETGGQAKDLIREGLVTINSVPAIELRKKIRVGDLVFYEDTQISIIVNPNAAVD